MAPPSFKQQTRRARIESVLGVAAPLLDLVLAVGDRVSRFVGPPDDYIAVRPPSDALELDSAKRSSRPPVGD